MSRFAVMLISLLFAAPVLAADGAAPEAMKYLFDEGDARYYAYQDDYFEALVRLDAQQAQSGGFAESAYGALFRPVGGIELRYRMDQRARGSIEAVIEGTARDDQRNEALFRLARLYFQKDQPENALHAVERIRGAVPAAIRADLAFLRANILMANGRNEEAVAVLKDLLDEKSLEGFSSYNLGIALLRSGNNLGYPVYLDRAGRIESDDRAVLAIKDKANLVLGEKLLSENKFEVAKQVLDRVRLSGPFSNRALLSSGWTDASRERFENALVPWSILAEREVADPAVQEAMLAVPYAYGKLGVYSTAALKYETALKAFEGEIGRLGASLSSIRQGELLKSLAREELKQDAGWAVTLRKLTEKPETFYLLDLMASQDFQESLSNYLDLEQLRKKLESWSGDLAAFEDIIRRRRAYYDPLLPGIDGEFRRLESEMRLRSEQRDRIAQLLKAMLTSPRPDLLATADEQIMGKTAARLEKFATPSREKGAPRLYNRIKRLRGVLNWKLNTEYEQRYADTLTQLQKLDQKMDILSRQYRAFVRTRQTTLESYQGYAGVIGSQRRRIAAARENVRALIARQGQALENMAVNELTKRRDRLEAFRAKARFALADSYDRASKTPVRKRDAQ